MPNRFPRYRGQLDQTNQDPGPVRDDDRARLSLLREKLPQHVLRGAVIDLVGGPEIPTAAVLDGGAETFDLSGGGTFEFIVEEYEGVKPRAGTPGSLEGAEDPARSLAAGNDRVTVAIAGEASQEVELGAQADGDAVAAALQTQVRALTAADEENQQAYDGFTAVYKAPKFDRLLKESIDNGAEVDFITLDDVSGIRTGDSLTIRGSTDEVVKVKDIDYAGKRLRVGRFTASAAYAVDAQVDSADDRYVLETGKFGDDMSIVVTDGATENAADLLKLRAGDGATGQDGTDNLGRQSIPYADADFADPAAATAAEVAVVLNKELTGAVASDNAGSPRLTSNRLGAGARLKALEGDARDKLGFGSDEEVGTETDIDLSLDSPEILAILPFNDGTGAPGNLISDIDGTVAVRRDKLENVSGSDHSADKWLVVSRPGS